MCETKNMLRHDDAAPVLGSLGAVYVTTAILMFSDFSCMPFHIRFAILAFWARVEWLLKHHTRLNGLQR